MDYLWIVLGLLGGLALFLYGMVLLSEGLQKAAGSRLRTILEKLTKSRIRGVATGAVATATIQSSSVTTVTLVGLINAGILTFEQAVPVIMGANIGTTVTAQLVAFKIGALALPIIAVGFAIFFLKRKTEYSMIGQSILGFGILFLGMNLMSSAVSPLRSDSGILELLVQFGAIPILGIIAGMIFTEIVQSSSATTALVIVLSAEGIIGLPAGIALIMGANIGTTITVVLASIGSTLSAKRAAVAHIMFNVLGVMLFLPFIGIFAALVAGTAEDIPRQIANAHTIFNVTVTLILLPFIGLFVIFIKRILPGEDVQVDSGVKHLDRRLLDTPSIALMQAENEAMRMGKIVKQMLTDSSKFFRNGDTVLATHIHKNEEVVDMLNTEIRHYASEISEGTLSHKEGVRLAQIAHAITDLERIGDHINNLAELQAKLVESRRALPKAEQREILQMYRAASDIFGKTLKVIKSQDIRLAHSVVERNHEIAALSRKFEQKNIERLESRKTDVELNVIYSSMRRNLRRISRHSSEISELVLEGF
ncbi:MAG: Na/Pi cotransporter family protein [Candidatus Diapherotrites archaeon]|nr:Na/Pi cotransporter family protein [Candidatus Micrarchaeota archaeon]MBU1939606.1 Na/Pi cotransporter family protein [Candidatus Micrarchaeota archaeon]